VLFPLIATANDTQPANPAQCGPGEGDRLQRLPAPPPRRATPGRALVHQVPDHPAHGEEQPAQPRETPALATPLRTPGGERAHRQPDHRYAKRQYARSIHPLNTTEPTPGNAAP
jgi:hypothetical protein